MQRRRDRRFPHGGNLVPHRQSGTIVNMNRHGRNECTKIQGKRTVVAMLFLTGWAALAPDAAALGDLIVDGGTLVVGCTNPFGNDAEFINQLQNPMSETRSASMHNSAATAAFNFNWSLATGHFRIDANMASEGGNNGPFCATDNRVNFSVTQDMLLSIDSEWTYQFNGGIRRTVIRFWVVDTTTDLTVFTRGDVGDTVAGDPWADTFHVNGSILLTPGNYFVRSLMDLSAVGGSANSVSTAHGFADITLTTVPEPAGVLMLALGGVFVGRRGTRRSNRVRPPDVKNSNVLSRR